MLSKTIIIFWLATSLYVDKTFGRQIQPPQCFISSITGSKNCRMKSLCQLQDPLSRRKYHSKEGNTALQETREGKTSGSMSPSASSAPSFWTMKELERHAHEEGVKLSWSKLGPGFRSTAISTHDESEVVGYAEGFIRPSGNIIHMDKMEMSEFAVQRCKRLNPSFRGGGTILGVGLFVAYQCISYGKEKGCKKVEFLAIDDDDYIHRRLVRYYTLFGFKVVKYVGDDIQDIPARLVWGGCGTLMEADIDGLLERWTVMMQRSLENRNRSSE